MAFTGTIEGAQRVVNNLSQLDDRVNDAAFRGVQRGVLGGQSIVRGNARGRPGPRAVRGDFNRSIVGEAEQTSTGAAGQIGTNAAQARRLEYGFDGPDRLGRVYSQPPYPYMQRSVAAVEALVVSEVRAQLAKALGR